MQEGAGAVSATSDNAGRIESPPVGRAARTSLLGLLGGFLRKTADAPLIVPEPAPVILSEAVQIGWSDQPFQLTLGNVALEFHPDLGVTGDEAHGNREWIVHTGSGFYDDIPEFVRLVSGETTVLGRADDLQRAALGLNKSVAGRHVRIFNKRGALTIEPLDPDRRTEIAAIASPAHVWKARRDCLERLPDVLGHPVAQLDDEKALEIISAVNAILATEAYREPDDEGNPGGIIKFPKSMTVVILGDIHARVDNLLRVLAEGGLLTALMTNEACLVFLGDLVHSQESGELEDMDSSVLILDLFAMLKCRFPENVFYVRGNHESFSSDVGKGGVAQGILFRKHLKQRRGAAYVDAVETLFSRLAFVVQRRDFAGCHGAPVRSRVDRNTLVNIQRYPGIQYELVWNRLRQGNRPAGYGKGSVKRFRQTLGLPKHAPVIVAPHALVVKRDRLDEYRRYRRPSSCVFRPHPSPDRNGHERWKGDADGVRARARAGVPE